ncbi:unnamed protein product [Cuscuta campestris]|uniref:Uncharacterized protein n=1 Tax=Cuscuta campestris TaxID=132261 RepID=A0A484KDV2_9ASTE|nr:unnamed protein product [Cuscuta campestris]
MVMVACGWPYTISMSSFFSGSLYTYGWSQHGQLGYGDCQDQAILSPINLNFWAVMSFLSYVDANGIKGLWRL